MRKDIHPEYREVVFQDDSANYTLITRSAVKTEDTMTVDGREYPVVKLDISSHSHPFYTGKQKLVDTGGRIDRLKKKFGDKMALGTQKKTQKTLSPIEVLRQKALQNKTTNKKEDDKKEQKK